jgi:Smg protein
MKNEVMLLDVLMYLFEYLDDEIELTQNEEALRLELSGAGFKRSDINKAFEWLETLAEQQETLNKTSTFNHLPIRVYTADECEKFNLESRSFLLFLEQAGALDTLSRELVIDRVMALELEHEEMPLEHLKWVILMVLFNQPGQEASYAWMENLIYEDPTALNLH